MADATSRSLFDKISQFFFKTRRNSLRNPRPTSKMGRQNYKPFHLRVHQSNTLPTIKEEEEEDTLTKRCLQNPTLISVH